jgi:hypothetical protein
MMPTTIHRHLAAAYLSGEKPLWKAFWGIFIVGAFCLGTLNIKLSSLFLFRMQHTPGIANIPLIIATTSLVYFSFAWICVWKCAKNCRNHVFHYLAQTLVALHAVVFLSQFIRLLFGR